MSEHASRGGEHAHRAETSAAPQRQSAPAPTPEQQAAWAATVARKLDDADAQVTASLDRMRAAQAAGDVVAFRASREAATSAVDSLGQLADRVDEYAKTAGDERVKWSLEAAPARAQDARARLHEAGAEPVARPPVLASQDAVLAALGDGDEPGDSKRARFDAAGNQLAQVFRQQMPWTDYAAFEQILREFPEHEISRQFRRLSTDRQRSLLGILRDDKQRAIARARTPVPTLQTVSAAPQAIGPRPVDPRPVDPGTGAPYVAEHLVHVVGVLYERMSANGLPQPHPRLPWAAIDAPSKIAFAIEEYASRAGSAALDELAKLAPAANLRGIVERTRANTVRDEWDSAVGMAIADALLGPIDGSIVRVGERVRVQVDARGAMPVASEVVTSNPLDRLMAEVMCQPGAVNAFHVGAAKRGDTHGRPFVRGVREVEWEPVADPKLWNVIRVISPKDATAEDVAHTPELVGEVSEEQADRIHATPPFFALPVDLALRVEKLAARAPAAVKGNPTRSPQIADGAELAASPLADEAVLAHAAPANARDPRADLSLMRADAQIAFLWSRLMPWSLAHPLLGATTFLQRRREDLARDPHAAATWRGPLAVMELVLFDIAREATGVVDELDAKITPADAALARPNVRVLEAYARAAGVAHLPGEGSARLAEARKMRALLPIALAEQSIESARGELDHQHGTAHELGSEPAQRQIDPAASALGKRAADLRLQVERTGHLDAEAAEALQVDADEVAVRARISRLQMLVKDIEERARAVGISDAGYANGLPTLFALANELDRRFPMWIGKLDAASHFKGPTENRTADQTQAAQRRTAITQVSGAITELDHVAQIGEWLRFAHKSIDDEALREKLLHLALELGIMIATGQIAGAATAALRGVVLGAELMAEAREVGMGWKAVEVLINAGLSTGSQGAMSGEVSAKDFATNVIAMGLSSAAMKPFESLLQDAAAVEADITKTWMQLAKGGLRFGAQVGVLTATGIGGSYLANGLMNHGETGDVGGDWLEQGLMIAASHYVAQRIQAMHDRVAESRKFIEKETLANLAARVEALRSRKPPKTTSDAHDAMAEYRAALLEERTIYEELAQSKDPQQAQAARIALEQASHDASANLVDASLRLSGLFPLVEGHVYEGTKAAIDAAIKRARETNEGLQHTYDAKTGTHTLRAGDKIYTIHETDPQSIRIEAPHRAPANENDAVAVRTSAEEGSKRDQALIGGQQPQALSAIDHGLIAELDVLERQESTQEVRAQIDDIEAKLGMQRPGEEGAQRRRMVDSQRGARATRHTRDVVASNLDGPHGHPGSELHSHFMGIVRPEVFRARAATAAGAADTGSWIPLLDELNRLRELHPEGEHGRDDANKRISKRSTTGDAYDIIKALHYEAKQYRKMAEVASNEADRTAYRNAAEELAEQAARKVLTATSQTPFDSAYEFRDELVKETFAGPKQEGENDEAMNQRAFDSYIGEALLELADGGVVFSQQSSGIGKVGKRFTPERLDAVLQKLIAEGRLRPGQVTVEMLTMLKTGYFGERDPRLPAVKETDRSDKAFQRDSEVALRQVAEGKAVGEDIGGPEMMSFTPEGMRRWTAHVVELSNLGKSTGRRQIARPHVGEGAVDTVDGKPFHTDENRVMNGGEPAHYERARHNLDMMLDALEQLPPGVLDPKFVEVRFGHATHATPEQVKRMKALGVIPEINLGSNVATGSISQTVSPNGPRSATERFDDHSFATHVYYESGSMLSTDGGGTMNTSLKEEYGRARTIIEAVLSGDLPVRVTVEDATVEGVVRGQPVAGRPGERELRVWDMTSTEKLRFENGYKRLYQDAERYYATRMRGDTSRHVSSVDAAVHAGIATQHGLTRRFGDTSFEGNSGAVAAAVDAYRKAGYRINGDGGELVLVTSPDQAMTLTLSVRRGGK